MWPHITEYCRIKRVQKSLNISLRCLELSLSQSMTHTPVSQSINKDVKQMGEGVWGGFVYLLGHSSMCTVATEVVFSTVQCCCKSLLWLFQWGKVCEYPSPLAPFYRPWHTSPWTKPSENVVGSVLLFNIPQFPNVSYHQNELVEDTAHSSSFSAYFWKHFLPVSFP